MGTCFSIFNVKLLLDWRLRRGEYNYAGARQCNSFSDLELNEIIMIVWYFSSLMKPVYCRMLCHQHSLSVFLGCIVIAQPVRNIQLSKSDNEKYSIIYLLWSWVVYFAQLLHDRFSNVQRLYHFLIINIRRAHGIVPAISIASHVFKKHVQEVRNKRQEENWHTTQHRKKKYVWTKIHIQDEFKMC